MSVVALVVMRGAREPAQQLDFKWTSRPARLVDGENLVTCACVLDEIEPARRIKTGVGIAIDWD